eukprot:4175706-Pyramimonas_sp.AAC.1
MPLFGAILGRLGAILGSVGAILGQYWGHIGAVLGPYWRRSVASWGHIGPSWSALKGRFRGILGRLA